MPAGSARAGPSGRSGALTGAASSSARRAHDRNLGRDAAATFGGRNLSYPCMVTSIAPQPEAHDTSVPPAPDPIVEFPLDGPPDQLAQLRFLHRIVRLATTARTWDELLETVVDETRDALHADVSSLYLLDRDGAYLTLAATNGLDRYQIGRARVPFGEGVTGQVAASHRPLIVPDVKADPRFLWVRGIDQRRFVASMLSVPLTWHDQVVGVLNVQTEQPRQFGPAEVAQLGAVADLLAGIVEKGRQQSEAEARVEALKAIDEARTELIALVTHELRTPLAVVRAYADLLAEEPTLAGRESRDTERRADPGGVAPARPSSRSSGSTGWSTPSSPRSGSCPRTPASVTPGRRRAPRRRGPRSLTPAARPSSASRSCGAPRLHALADPPRLRQIVEHLVENAVKYAPAGTTITVDWGARTRGPSSSA